MSTDKLLWWTKLAFHRHSLVLEPWEPVLTLLAVLKLRELNLTRGFRWPPNLLRRWILWIISWNLPKSVYLKLLWIPCLKKIIAIKILVGVMSIRKQMKKTNLKIEVYLFSRKLKKYNRTLLSKIKKVKSKKKWVLNKLKERKHLTNK